MSQAASMVSAYPGLPVFIFDTLFLLYIVGIYITNTYPCDIIAYSFQYSNMFNGVSLGAIFYTI